MGMIEAVRARQNRKSGRIAITFEVDAGAWENMRRRAVEGSHFGRLDFIKGALNMAFLECFELPPPPGPPVPGEDDDGIPF